MNGNDYGDYSGLDFMTEAEWQATYQHTADEEAAAAVDDQAWYEAHYCPCDGRLDELTNGTRVCSDCKAVYPDDAALAQAHHEAQAERDAEDRAGMLRDCGIR